MNFNPQKTEIMLISNLVSDPKLNFFFDNKNIPLTDHHKHFGIYFSNDAKWNFHIDSIIKSSTKYISTLRKLKYTLSRKNLEKMYLVFIRPLLEYACELWDNCNISASDRLENIQLEAARIITGLPIFTKKDFIYKELGWKTLKQRREERKLTLLYKIINCKVPLYLKSLLPPLVSDISSYRLRDINNFQLPLYRLSLTESSFVPNTCKAWNNLPNEIKTLNSLPRFKKATRKEEILPTLYSTNYFQGKRILNILHCRLRNRVSALNYDLFYANITDDPSCECGSACENAQHYFFECVRYVNQRHILFNDLSWYNNKNLNHFLFGDNNITVDENILLAKSIQKFIESTKRF